MPHKKPSPKAPRSLTLHTAATIPLILLTDFPWQGECLKHYLLTQASYRNITPHCTPKEVFQTLKQHPEARVLMDAYSTHYGGLDLAHNILIAHPNTILVSLSNYVLQYHANICQEAGFRGYIANYTDMQGITIVLHEVITCIAFSTFGINTNPDEDTAAAAIRLKDLGEREWEVLELLTQGKTIEESASILNGCYNTIKKQRRNIYQKVGTSNIQTLIRLTDYLRQNHPPSV